MACHYIVRRSCRVIRAHAETQPELLGQFSPTDELFSSHSGYSFGYSPKTRGQILREESKESEMSADHQPSGVSAERWWISQSTIFEELAHQPGQLSQLARPLNMSVDL
jgi:hypothetical protein